MKITTEEALSRLANNPKVAAQFDACSPGLSRRENVQKTIAAIDAAIAENVAIKAKIQATKTKLAALEAAKLSHSLMKTPSTPSTAPTASHTAATFAKLPPTMTRAEFQKLSPADRLRFSQSGGKLI